jgi:hypothetical protein
VPLLLVLDVVEEELDDDVLVEPLVVLLVDEVDLEVELDVLDDREDVVALVEPIPESPVTKCVELVYSLPTLDDKIESETAVGVPLNDIHVPLLE